ncbi:MAG: AGE family epimerase/isomerase [Mediterranea sp.]|jgi:mannobiose 2-epimerase|nr:AGE family epimerase/isomerase [Mediterranea sp.]
MDLSTLRKELEAELTTNILPFWMDRMVDEREGGFYGRVTGTDMLVPEAAKGAVLNARILWTFSAAYRLLRKEEYFVMATRAKRYLLDRFVDPVFGGVCWSVDYAGDPLEAKKQTYAIGFAIYGLSEYHRATGDAEALTAAIHLAVDIERHCYDLVWGGYREALTRSWQELADMRLSEKDANERKTMNTHLHILEPYTNLYRVCRDERLERQLRGLVELFVDKIVDPRTGHLGLFFSDDWTPRSNTISYGHDIEASWLLHEAALTLGDDALLRRVEPVVKRIAAAAAEGLNAEGGMMYERFPDSDITDADCHWWVQAENVVGHVNLYQHFADEEALRTALRGWAFIKRHLVDTARGEWHWSLRANGTVNTDDDKAGFWKCPYHNGRMCLELIGRMGQDKEG